MGEKPQQNVVSTEPYDDSALEFVVQAKVEECYHLADLFYQRTFVRPPVYFDLTGKTAGMFVFRRGASLVWLRINRLLLRHSTDEIIHQVVPHEIAHHLTHVLHGEGVAPHGIEWRMIMIRVFHLNPDVTHRMDVSRAVRVAYIYECQQCQSRYTLSQRKHENFLQGERYSCRSCRSPIKFLCRLDPTTGAVMHELAIRSLYLAIDKDWRDVDTFIQRVSEVLRNEKPGGVYSLYRPEVGSPITEWAIRKKIKYNSHCSASDILTTGLKSRISHAVAFTRGHDKQILSAMSLLKAARIHTRVLRIG